MATPWWRPIWAGTCIITEHQTGTEGAHMSEEKSRAERSVDWQNRYLTPILLVVGLLLVAGAGAVSAIPWWLAVVLLAFGVFAVVRVVSRNRKNT